MTANMCYQLLGFKGVRTILEFDL